MPLGLGRPGISALRGCMNLNRNITTTIPQRLRGIYRVIQFTARRDFTLLHIRRMAPAAKTTTWRVAIIGSGPAGFYTAQRLLKFKPPPSLLSDASKTAVMPLQVDMLEAMPVPYGLVRYGVAPDHPEVKAFFIFIMRSIFRILKNALAGRPESV